MYLYIINLTTEGNSLSKVCSYRTLQYTAHLFEHLVVRLLYTDEVQRSSVLVHDTYFSSTDSEKWKKEFAVGYRPRGRRSHCAVSIGNDILYFAGYNAVRKQHFADMFTVNTGELVFLSMIW